MFTKLSINFCLLAPTSFFQMYDGAFYFCLSTSNCKCPQLGDDIRLDLLWRQNHNLYCILHSKNHLKIFGGVLLLGDRPPKIPTFSGSGPKRLERGPQYSACRRNFKKSSLSTVIMCLGYNLSQRNCTSFQYLRCPNHKTKKVPFLAISAPFSTKWLEHCGFQD